MKAIIYYYNERSESEERTEQLIEIGSNNASLMSITGLGVPIHSACLVLDNLNITVNDLPERIDYDVNHSAINLLDKEHAERFSEGFWLTNPEHVKIVWRKDKDYKVSNIGCVNGMVK